MAGYHKRDIAKGKYGEVSKIIEEVLELEDAVEQKNKIMALVEVSDIIGAVQGFLAKEFGDTIMLKDVIRMAKATHRSFRNGGRR